MSLQRGLFFVQLCGFEESVKSMHNCCKLPWQLSVGKTMLKLLLRIGIFLALINLSISLDKEEKGQKWKKKTLIQKGFNLVERVLKRKQAIKFDDQGRITEIDTEKVREVKNLFVELTGLPFGAEVVQPCLHAAQFGMRTGTLAKKIVQKRIVLAENGAKKFHPNDELCLTCLMDSILEDIDMEWNQIIPLLHLDLEQTLSPSLDMDEMECLVLVKEVEHESGDQFYKYDLYTQMMTGHDMKGEKKINTNDEMNKQSHASKMESLVTLVMVCFAMLEYAQ